MSWRGIEVAPEGTHHHRDGAPLYAERFDSVLPFHEPGLAPVRRGAAAWHIDVEGKAAYARRFRQTFGFYEERAAVEAEDGWLHIDRDGRGAYDARYAWCGNFQGGLCTVRQRDGRYLHIDPMGSPAYAARWRYAGDFREGCAVVQGDDGRSTHVDRHGELVHGKWFDDLDVFHKGFARARDGGGWFHVDRDGKAAYGRRFAEIEPFYNGQARVERLDRVRDVILPDGTIVLSPLTEGSSSPLRSDLSAPAHHETLVKAFHAIKDKNALGWVALDTKFERFVLGAIAAAINRGGERTAFVEFPPRMDLVVLAARLASRPGRHLDSRLGRIRMRYEAKAGQLFDFAPEQRTHEKYMGGLLNDDLLSLSRGVGAGLFFISEIGDPCRHLKYFAGHTTTLSNAVTILEKNVRNGSLVAIETIDCGEVDGTTARIHMCVFDPS